MSTPTEKLKAFKKEFLNLTTNAANNGVPLQNLILELETEKFRLLAINFQRTSEAEAAAMVSAILPANAIPNLKLNKN